MKLGVKGWMILAAAAAVGIWYWKKKSADDDAALRSRMAARQTGL